MQEKHYEEEERQRSEREHRAHCERGEILETIRRLEKRLLQES